MNPVVIKMRGKEETKVKKYGFSRLVVVFLALSILPAATAVAQLMAGPFQAEAEIDASGEPAKLTVTIDIPKDHYIYAHKFDVKARGDLQLKPSDIPAAVKKYDKYLEKEIEIYKHSTNFVYSLPKDSAEPVEIEISYQGCGPDICYPPETKDFSLTISGKSQDGGSARKDAADEKSQSGTKEELANELDEFKVAAKTTGYMDSENFIGFLENSDGATSGEDMFAGKGFLLIILIILAGGFALNLTPCVLPMIPINIAIIGAGAQASSKTRGFLLGGTYGLGIALAYGGLGLLVVLTGAKFGALNSSPWFNLGIAALFVVLALSMFGVFNIDLSRFQGGTGKPIKGGRFWTAFGLGIVAALLAGACVAPVVISVLLYSTTLYADGNFAGLILPFLLGVGMALPWPFAGAGLSFLPKTGAWMEKVKYAFGIIILIAAVYYGKLGIDLLQSKSASDRKGTSVAEESAEAHKGWLTSLDKALEKAKTENKPIFIDFWAEWCKSCLKMDKTTFKDPEVIEKLDSYVKLKIDGDRKDAATQLAMDRYVEVGLPTYVVLERKE